MGLFSLSEKFATLGATAVDNQFLLEFMPNAYGEAVKGYLYGLLAVTSQMQDMSVDQMAHDLGMTREDVLAAYRHWERVGLVERTGDNPLSFRYIPVNQSVFMGNTAPRDLDYERFTEAVYAVFGNDYRIHGQRILQFYEWVVDLGLPQEVVLMLIRHMISLRGKNFSYAAANKLAETLAKEDVRTIEDAELALTRDREVRECSRAVLRKLGMRREPTEPEQNLCQKWMHEWHYSQDAILAACDETTAAGSPSFKYVDSILEKRRSGQNDVGSSAEAYKAEQTRQEQRREPLKKVFEALGRGTINEGTLNVYWNLRKNCDNPELILFAAQQCGKANGKLEDVINLISSWQKRGIGNEAEARAYVEQFEDEKKLLAALGDLWGIRPPAGEANHRLIQKWRAELKMPDDVIVYAAGGMKVDSKHMPYLDRILDRYDAQNIRSVDAAEADSQRYSENKPQPEKGRTGKVVTESLYDQRENTEPDAQSIPQWLLDRQKEMKEHATGDSSPADK